MSTWNLKGKRPTNLKKGVSISKNYEIDRLLTLKDLVNKRFETRFIYYDAQHRMYHISFVMQWPLARLLNMLELKCLYLLKYKYA